MKNYRLPLFGLTVAGLTMPTGCTHAKQSPMSYKTCAAAKVCTVRGVASAKSAEHAWMARLELPDGQCISVSLPDTELNRLRQDGPKEMSITGRVYGDPSASTEIAFMKVEGRKIGLGLCGDFFVFVRDR